MVQCFLCKRNQPFVEKGIPLNGFLKKLSPKFKTNSFRFVSLAYRYGIHLAQALTKTVIERGYTPFVVIRPENDASRNLYTKLGFVKAFETCRVTLNPEGKAAAIKPNGGLLLARLAQNGDDAQLDEGIEDGAEQVTAKKSAATKQVAKDEGIDDEDGKVG